jgi:acetylornithine deacetylase
MMRAVLSGGSDWPPLGEEEDILRSLVAKETIAGGSNADLVAELAALLDGPGCAVWVGDGVRAGTQVLHAVVGPADEPGGVLLAAHGDVVAVAGQAWSSDPFVLRRNGGRLFGRGSVDMKGFLALALSAARRLRRKTLNAPLHLAVSHDEELGCAGVRPLLDRLAVEVAAPLAGVVVGEPTRLAVVEQHKGKAALKIRLTGRAGHSATPAAGVNAVRAAARAVLALDEVQASLVGEERDDAFSVPHATIGVGPIRGGVSLNVIPDLCEVEVEVRALPGQRLEALVERVRAAAQAAAGAAEMSLETIASYPPLAPSEGRAWARRVSELSRCELGGAVDFGSEAGLYAERLGCEVVVFGPGEMRLAHGADENIGIDELRAGRAALERLIVGALIKGGTS